MTLFNLIVQKNAQHCFKSSVCCSRFNLKQHMAPNLLHTPTSFHHYVITSTLKQDPGLLHCTDHGVLAPGVGLPVVLIAVAVGAGVAPGAGLPVAVSSPRAGFVVRTPLAGCRG